MMSIATETGQVADEWQAGSLDLDAYLARTGQQWVAPSAAALRELHAAHVRTFPFENVDVVLEQHRGLDLEVIFEKFVGRRRGGYCYEHALLFAAVLERLGYPVRRCVARVQPGRPGPYTHMMLIVEADGVDHLVDVGFGAGVMYPMPLVDGGEVDQVGWTHRVVFENGWWSFEKQVGDGWERLHSFADTASRHVDYEVYHHYCSTHPKSPFVGRLVLMRLDEGSSHTFVGNRLTVDYPDGRSETTEIAPDRLDETLRGLDIELDAEELAALLGRYQSKED